MTCSLPGAQVLGLPETPLSEELTTTLPGEGVRQPESAAFPPSLPRQVMGLIPSHLPHPCCLAKRWLSKNSFPVQTPCSCTSASFLSCPDGSHQNEEAIEALGTGLELFGLFD